MEAWFSIFHINLEREGDGVVWEASSLLICKGKEKMALELVMEGAREIHLS